MSIVVDNLSKSFSVNFWSKKKQAVKNVSLTVKKGEILGIIGHNGAGKSSIIKMIMGFIRPDSGQITIAGKSPLSPDSRKIVGYLPESPYFYDHLTAQELLEFSIRASAAFDDKAKAHMDSLLKRMGLYHVKDQKLRSYSKGMTQRTGLCFALVHDPEIIILDEPMSGLDPSGRKLVVDLILDLKSQGKTVLFCSHILSDVERICDRVAAMDGGELKRVFTRDDIMRKNNRIRIIVDRTTQKLDDEITLLDGDIYESGNHKIIECDKKQMDNLLPSCRREQVNIISIDSTINNMEKIFFKAVGEN